MARPRKDGLEYFPHDVDASTDPKLEPSILRFGAAAYAFYFIHLEYCYRSNDLCIDISDTEMGTEMREVIQRKLQVDDGTYKAILQSLLRHGAFDRQLFEETGKLTSNGIKKRASKVFEKRKRDAEYYEKKISGAETGAETPQRKEKQSKAKHSKAKHSKEDNNNSFVVVGEDGAVAESAEQAVDGYLTDRGLSIDQYFGATEEVKAQAADITREIFKKMTLRSPTDQDIFRVFQHAKASRELDGGEWEISFPKDRVDLLLYSFEQAAAAGCPGNWRYIEGCLGRMAERGILTLAQAEDFDYERDYPGG